MSDDAQHDLREVQEYFRLPASAWSKRISTSSRRLKKENSDLIKLAIDELHAKHKAKRAFGDA